jgi:hypothetical protein
MPKGGIEFRPSETPIAALDAAMNNIRFRAYWSVETPCIDNLDQHLMSKDQISILQQSQKLSDDAKSLGENAKINTMESSGAVAQPSEAIIRSRKRRKRRTVIIR